MDPKRIHATRVKDRPPSALGYTSAIPSGVNEDRISKKVKLLELEGVQDGRLFVPMKGNAV